MFIAGAKAAVDATKAMVMVLVNCIYAEDRVKSKEKSAIGFGNIMNKVGFDRVHNDKSHMSMTLVTMLNSHVHSLIHT